MIGFAVQDGMFRMLSGDELFHDRMRRLIFTPINSAIGFLTKGSRVIDYFWEAAQAQSAQAILSEIKVLIASYEKSAKLLTIGVRLTSPANTGVQQIEITLEFDVNGVKTKTIIQNERKV